MLTDSTQTQTEPDAATPEDTSRHIIYASEPALTADGVETLARCGFCGDPYVPHHARHFFCTPECRAGAHAQTAKGKVTRSRSQRRQHERNHSYRQARRSLIRAGKDPDAHPKIDILRGKGIVKDWRSVIGLTARRPGRPRAASEASEVEATPVTRASGERANATADALVTTDAPAPALDPWSLPSPAVEHIGHALAVGFSPPAAIDLTGTRLLHGAITFVVAEPHERRRAGWALAPSDRGWVAVFNNRATAERMRAQSFNSRLGAEHRRLIFGSSLVHAKGPRPLPAGRYRVTFETVTPVVWGSFGKVVVTTSPTPDTILASVERIALFVGAEVPFAHRAVESVSSETRCTKVFAGGKWRRGSAVNGLIRGIEGRVSVVCNAPVAWLLACGEVVGVGSSSSIGFGRVRVRVCPL